MFFAVLTASMVFWGLLVWGAAGHPTQMSQWIWDAYGKKQHISRSIRERKIVVVAGSNALFGVDSEILSDAFGMPVVNYAVNAGIELPCTLFMAQKVIRKGDTVIMPLEYPMYSYGGEPGMQMTDFLLAREPKCFWKLTLKEQFYLLWHVSMKRVWEGYKTYENSPVKSGLYGAHHIDAHGDQNGTSLSERTESMYREVLKYRKNPEVYGSTFDTEALGWKYLEKFTAWCRARDVKVIFMPSTLMRHKSYEKDLQEKWFYGHIAQEVQKRGWHYVGDPYAYMYEPPMYLNSNFHLIRRGREIRTRKMVKDLKRSGLIPVN